MDEFKLNMVSPNKRTNARLNSKQHGETRSLAEALDLPEIEDSFFECENCGSKFYGDDAEIVEAYEVLIGNDFNACVNCLKMD